MAGRINQPATLSSATLNPSSSGAGNLGAGAQQQRQGAGLGVNVNNAASNRSASPYANLPTTPTQGAQGAGAPHMNTMAVAVAQAQQQQIFQSLQQQHQQMDKQIQDFFGGEAQVPPARAILIANDVTASRGGLQRLANSGCWREAVRLCELALQQNDVGGSPMLPHQRLWWRHACLVCLFKLHMYDQGEAELRQMDLNADQTMYEFYPQLYPGRKGSMVPFAMRVLHAKMPAAQAESQALPEREGLFRESLNRFYTLTEFVRANLRRVRACPPAQPQHGTEVSATHDPLQHGDEIPQLEELDTVSAWEAREQRVQIETAQVHANLNQLQCAIGIVGRVLETYTPDVRASRPGGQSEFIRLLQRLGTLRIQAGQINLAEDEFSRIDAVDESVLSADGQRLRQIALQFNQGLLHMCHSRYEEAQECFTAVLQIDPLHTTAANNRAVCHLYRCNINDAIGGLEDLIRRNPREAATESVIYNLSTLYDLQGETAIPKKRVLQGLTQRYIGDHFPQRAFKMT